MNACGARTAEFLRVLRDRLPELKETHGVKSVGLFGSYLRGEETEDSDIDILVEFERVPDLFDFVALGRHISDLLGVRADLVMKGALKPGIGKRILEEVIMV